jgi:hypothetical protein
MPFADRLKRNSYQRDYKQKTATELRVLREKMKQCPLLINCKEVANMNCVGRDFGDCDWFKVVLGDYCGRIHNRCKKCVYFKKCKRSEKIEAVVEVK